MTETKRNLIKLIESTEFSTEQLIKLKAFINKILLNRKGGNK